MNTLVMLYRKLDAVQSAMWFHILASAVSFLLVAGFVFIARSGADWLPVFLIVDKTTAPFWVGGIVLLWLALIVWLDLAITFLLIVFGVAFIAVPLAIFGRLDLSLAVGGFGVLTFTFMLLIKGLLALFSQPNQIFAIANTVIKESVRLKVSVAFIFMLLIILPLLPLLVGADQALRYRIQSFIGYSMGATFYFAAFMTVFLACGTIAFEIRDRQIWQLMTKPVSRINYLIGKWIGIVSVNLALLIVTGVSIFIFVQYLRYQRPANDDDGRRVEDEVLVARVGSLVYLEPIDTSSLRDAIDKRITDNFTLQEELRNGEKDEAQVRRTIATEIRNERSLRQRTIEVGAKKQYVFKNLGAAKRMGKNLKLRYQIHTGEEDTHEENVLTILVYKDGQPSPYAYPESYVPTMSHYVELPIGAVADDGTVTIEIANGELMRDLSVRVPQGLRYSINFDPEDLEILYAVGGFEMNYARAMTVTWVKLAFLTMVGLAAATVLSFPVAVMMTFTVFLAAIIGPFLAASLDLFDVGHWYRVDRWLIKGIAIMLVYLFEPFGETNPAQKLVEGRLIPWWSVLRAIGLLGFAWTGVAMVLGYLGFKDRELAIYSGNG